MDAESAAVDKFDTLLKKNKLALDAQQARIDNDRVILDKMLQKAGELVPRIEQRPAATKEKEAALEQREQAVEAREAAVSQREANLA